MGLLRAARIRCGAAERPGSDVAPPTRARRIRYESDTLQRLLVPLTSAASGEPFGERSMVALISLLFLFVFCAGYQYYHFHH